MPQRNNATRASLVGVKCAALMILSLPDRTARNKTGNKTRHNMTNTIKHHAAQNDRSMMVMTRMRKNLSGSNIVLTEH